MKLRESHIKIIAPLPKVTRLSGGNGGRNGSVVVEQWILNLMIAL